MFFFLLLLLHLLSSTFWYKFVCHINLNTLIHTIYSCLLCICCVWIKRSVPHIIQLNLITIKVLRVSRFFYAATFFFFFPLSAVLYECIYACHFCLFTRAFDLFTSVVKNTAQYNTIQYNQSTQYEYEHDVGHHCIAPCNNMTFKHPHRMNLNKNDIVENYIYIGPIKIDKLWLFFQIRRWLLFQNKHESRSLSLLTKSTRDIFYVRNRFVALHLTDSRHRILSYFICCSRKI